MYDCSAKLCTLKNLFHKCYLICIAKIILTLYSLFLTKFGEFFNNYCFVKVVLKNELFRSQFLFVAINCEL